jgi:biopolymer transport protein ExbD
MYESTRPWREIGDTWLGFYAAQHTASENPQFTRRQHGLLGWLNGATMAYNYEFELGVLNDRAYTLYRPMVVTYNDNKGLMETIQYAGFREACDDIRYATYLRELSEECLKKGDVDARLLAKKARMYLAMLKRDSVDLNLARLEMIDYILKMRKALGFSVLTAAAVIAAPADKVAQPATLTEAQKKDETIELSDGRNGIKITPENLPLEHMQIDIAALDKDGRRLKNPRISISDREISLQDVKNILLERKKRYGHEFPVLIRVDERTPHGMIRDVMDQCVAAGIWKISFTAVAEDNTSDTKKKK